MFTVFKIGHSTWKADDQCLTYRESVYDYGGSHWTEVVIPYTDITEINHTLPRKRGQKGSLSIHYSHTDSNKTDSKLLILYYFYKNRGAAKDVYYYIKRYMDLKDTVNKDVNMETIDKVVKRNRLKRRTFTGIAIAVVVAIFIIGVISFTLSPGSSSSSDEWWRQYGYHSQEEAYNDAGYYKGSDGKWYR